MKRLAILWVCGLMAYAGFGGAEALLALDCRTGTRAITNGTEMIEFSPLWVTNASGATATIAINGTAVTNATEAGTFLWTPTQDGTYSLTHAVAVGGTPVGATRTYSSRVEV